MKCPLCQLETRIVSTRNIVENDNTPDAETKLFVIQEMACMNEQCGNYKTVVGEAKTELPIG